MKNYTIEEATTFKKRVKELINPKRFLFIASYKLVKITYNIIDFFISIPQTFFYFLYKIFSFFRSNLFKYMNNYTDSLIKKVLKND